MDRDSAKTIGRIFAKYLTVLTTHAAHLGVTLCSFATLSTFLQELQLELSSFALHGCAFFFYRHALDAFWLIICNRFTSVQKGALSGFKRLANAI